MAGIQQTAMKALFPADFLPAKILCIGEESLLDYHRVNLHGLPCQSLYEALQASTQAQTTAHIASQRAEKASVIYFCGSNKKAGKRDMHICRLMIVCLLWRLFVGLRRLFCGVPYEVVGGS